MAVDPIRVGIVLREQDLGEWAGRLRELAEHAVAAGIDHLTVGDHVSFADGHGADGLIQATALLTAHPRLPVQTGVYLVGLRHPAVVARQLATIALLAPGRFTFGVGVGGDDPSELELCGIDPRERGARTTEALRCIRLFLQGDEVEFRGRFFDLRSAIRGMAGWRCGCRPGASPRRSTESNVRPRIPGGAASAGSMPFSCGRVSMPLGRRRGSGWAGRWRRRTR